jgi:hypothetical protein
VYTVLGSYIGSAITAFKGFLAWLHTIVAVLQWLTVVFTLRWL